ncbi:GlxA family transcriptional regulator [Microvirga tunisiensis]|uniref:GlxA family transcriptional regulator n=1 Tax=Microvirga tunisiensis TaxID=2108360 RepID=UPI00128D202F|nr:helix-turn-helix domain-containing protein [Microvirga tunisiensis]MPR11261.1 helix-turn-helix domain-containing protein [Microvirga tunisiensis]
MRNGPIRVSLTVFPESDPSIIYGIFDTLWAAGRLWDGLTGRPPQNGLVFEPRLVASRCGPMELVTGVSIIIQDAVEDVPETDFVFVPNVMVDTPADLRRLDRGLIDWIGHMYRGGAYVYAACGGSLVLAEAGLLDGLEATTHWGYADLLRRGYPNVRVCADRILVQAGPGQRIVSAGGASSWQDLVLYLVAKHVGTEEALRLSKVFLYQWHRDGQLPYAFMVRNVTHSDAVIREQQEWLAANYERPHIVSEIVQRSGLPSRSFARRFKVATGYTPIAYVQALRIEEAKQLLETTDMAVDAIGAEVGYQDTTSFHRLFRRLTAMTPAAYRRKFRLPNFLKVMDRQPLRYIVQRT